MTEVECPVGHRHEYDSALAVPFGCPDCGALLSRVGGPTQPEDTKSDKV